jgi:hypothetical protein
MKPKQHPHVWKLSFDFAVEAISEDDTGVLAILQNMDDALAQLVSDAFLNLHKMGKCAIHTSSGIDDVPNAIIQSGIFKLPNTADILPDDDDGFIPNVMSDDVFDLMSTGILPTPKRSKKFND